MKEIYYWVPWFSNLSRKIAKEGDELLATRARQIPWRQDGSEPALLRFGDEHIDPFSFINYLGSLARYAPGRTRVYKGVEEVFGVPSPFDLDADDEFIFRSLDQTPRCSMTAVRAIQPHYGVCSVARSKGSIPWPPRISTWPCRFDM